MEIGEAVVEGEITDPTDTGERIAEEDKADVDDLDRERWESKRTSSATVYM